MLRRNAIALVVIISAAGCPGSSESLETPRVVASSKYVDYATSADTSFVCMQNVLADWDKFIDDTADYLEVGTPAKGILYRWMPQGASFTQKLPCKSLQIASACTRQDSPEYDAVIYDSQLEPDNSYHELVHAVEIAISKRTHPLLKEGMAEYLSDPYTTSSVLIEFPEEFTLMLERSPHPDNYTIAMHFVGSLLEHGGVDKFKKFRSLIPVDGKIKDFSDSYQQIYHEDFLNALVEMSDAPIAGRGTLWGCRGETPLEWSSDGVLKQKLEADCGDANLYGGGSSYEDAYYTKVFTLEIASAGIYEFSIEGEGFGYVDGCPGYPGGGSGFNNVEPRRMPLSEGRYRMPITFLSSSLPIENTTVVVTRDSS